MREENNIVIRQIRHSTGIALELRCDRFVSGCAQYPAAFKRNLFHLAQL